MSLRAAFWLILAIWPAGWVHDGMPPSPAADDGAGSSGKAIAFLSVDAGAHARLDTPLRVPLPAIPQLGTPGLELIEVTDGADRPVPAQVEPGHPPHLLWLLDGRTPAGATRSFEIRLSETGRIASREGLRDDGEGLTVLAAGREVLTYRHQIQSAPPGVDSLIGRSGFIHPLRSPEGQELTTIQPPDHHHHYGIWSPWTRVDVDGRTIDFWNLGAGQGTVRADGISRRWGGPLAAGFRAHLDHVVLDGTAGGRTVLNEEWDVGVWGVDGDRSLNVIDFVSTLSPATDSAFAIRAYRYQGFSVRATPRWGDDTASILTSEGHDKSTGNATRARWIDVRGESDAPSGRSGFMILSHSANHNHPEPLRIWPTGMNGGRENVFVNFNPAQGDDWILHPGQSYVRAYRLVTYDGDLGPGDAERLWTDFVEPPRVTVRVTALSGRRVLVYTRNGEGYVHDNIQASVDAIRSLAEQHGFDVRVSDAPDVFAGNLRDRFDAIVFANTNNDAFTTDDQREALQAFVRAGGGFVGIHSASGSERGWPWFSALLGGNFVRHAPRQDFTVEVVDPVHPATAFLPGRWGIEDDECYYLDELNPGIRTLLAADLSTVEDPGRDEYPGTLFGDRFPIAWVQEFDGGRQFYTALGHRIEHYSDPLFRRHLLGGLQWVVHGESP